jgi:sugar phosphate isomerase/epimerase
MNPLIRSLGVMQGRLLPKYQGRYQAHPLGYWQEEFAIAAGIGFDYIEFILDYNDAALNPLMSAEGVKEIISQVAKTNVGVRSVCADYFMEAPLHHTDTAIADTSMEVLQRLMHNSKEIGITDIVIPCVDQSSLTDAAAKQRFVTRLLPMQDLAEKLSINLSLETDLGPDAFGALLSEFTSYRITVNYDTGNSASLGYDPIKEFESYGSRISDIHIKDRKFKGGSVLLGTGDADFNFFFKALATLVDYDGPFIMQAFRDDEGVAITKQQFNWLQTNFNTTL